LQSGLGQNQSDKSTCFNWNIYEIKHFITMELSKLAGKRLIVIGLVIVTLGIIFTLQSVTVVGPSSSFMYSNPTWTLNGYIIIGIGLGVIIIGTVIGYYSKGTSN
jgi:uncharacterized BrkB/YihY/UPF0761 family membrane protein